MTATTETTSRVHQFEQAGLGLAPFKYLGMDEKWFVAAPGCPRKPGSSCDYCGQSIAIVCQIESADGKRFHVGCDCVRKVDNARNKRSADPVTLAMDRDRRAMQTAKRHARENDKLESGRAMLNANADRMDAMPHPVSEWAERGQTLADFATWYMSNAGTTGKLSMMSRVKIALGEA